MQYKRRQMILGTLAAFAVVCAWSATAADREAGSNAGVQPQREFSRDAPREIRRPLRDREFLRRPQAEDGASPEWRPRRRLTDEERQSLRRDLDRARREFYRDQDRHPGPDRADRPSLPNPPDKPNPPSEPVQGENK